MARDAVLIIPAAGKSQRMGGGSSKLFLELGGKSVLERALEPFLKFEIFKKIIVTANPGFIKEYPAYLASKDPRLEIIPGGETRQLSVFNALKQYKEQAGETSSTLAVIHDAARCLVDTALIERALEAAKVHPAVSAAVAVTDSLIKCANDGAAEGYIPREGVYALQTPQLFNFDLIYERHLHFKGLSKTDFTDDTALVKDCSEIRIISGARDNIKITTPDDLKLAECILSARGAA